MLRVRSRFRDLNSIINTLCPSIHPSVCPCVTYDSWSRLHLEFVHNMWYTTLYKASSAAAPPGQSPRVPFVAQGMSLVETSSFTVLCSSPLSLILPPHGSAESFSNTIIASLLPLERGSGKNLSATL